ncbi:MAG: trypsin-like peptidase domain-containing protein [Verrucomicrobiota bacterium]
MLKRTLALFLLLVVGVSLRAAEPEKSVVRIMTFGQEPVWNAPWRFSSVSRGTGSGFVVKGRRIMTNAHVVSWARQILVKRHQDPRPYRARVVFIAHDCDLALLEVEEGDFFSGMEPLGLGELPEVRSTVVTYGYPAGGEQISYTRGVVSRIELQNYVHIGNRAFVTVQTDAAINPGNSGGPVIQDNLVVGVAFQGTPGLENTGFFIPPSVIRHFLKDIEDGNYHGHPRAGIGVMPLQNPAQRRLLKLPDNDVGSRIDNILPLETTRKVLHEDDVILQVGSYVVASDATILFHGNRLSVSAAFQDAQHGESIPLKIWRGGKELSVSLPVYAYDADRKEGNQYDVLPRYYVYAGLVFTPLSLDYMRTFGRNFGDASSSELLYELTYRQREAPKTVRPEPIVLAGVLSDEVNANMRVQSRALVDKINGIRIEKLEDVIRAIESCQTAQHIIEYVPRGIECIDREPADKVNARILETYGVPKDRRL